MKVFVEVCSDNRIIVHHYPTFLKQKVYVCSKPKKIEGFNVVFYLRGEFLDNCIELPTWMRLGRDLNLS